MINSHFQDYEYLSVFDIGVFNENKLLQMTNEEQRNVVVVFSIDRLAYNIANLVTFHLMYMK